MILNVIPSLNNQEAAKLQKVHQAKVHSNRTVKTLTFLFLSFVLLFSSVFFKQFVKNHLNGKSKYNPERHL